MHRSASPLLLPGLLAITCLFKLADICSTFARQPFIVADKYRDTLIQEEEQSQGQEYIDCGRQIHGHSAQQLHILLCYKRTAPLMQLSFCCAG
jgi:hypothetical protein